MLWGEDDTLGRWIQGICGLIALPIAVFMEWQSWHMRGYWLGTGGFGLGYVGVRCLWYAITGRNNINRDGLNSGNFS